MYAKSNVVYSNVWEDPELNKQALQVKPEDTVLSITSGGCNSLNLLLENPKKVISIDCNPGQVALLDLKIAAFKELNYEELIDFLGVKIFKSKATEDPKRRLVVYGRVRKHLPDSSRMFWDENLRLVEKGVIHSGAVERFFKIYRRIVRTLYAVDGADKLFFCKTLDEQRDVYGKIHKNRVRLLNHLILNKFVLGVVKGRHSFKYVNNLNFGRNFNLKLRQAFQNTLMYENYFLSFILLGAYTDLETAPPYLRPSNFAAMKKNIGQLDNRLATLADIRSIYGDHSITKFNLSNIFEWFDEEKFNEVFSDVLNLSAPGARLCYRYTLARPQNFNAELGNKLVKEEELSKKLHAQDRAFMYESFHVYHLSEGHA